MRSRSLAGIAVGALTTGGISPAATAAPDGEAVRHCSTYALSAEEILAGETSVFECFDTPTAAIAAARSSGPSPSARSGSFVLAYHYDNAGATGSSFYTVGSDCNGGGLSLAAGDWWANRISSTKHHGCSAVKHWSGTGYTGSAQTTEGGMGAVRNLDSTLNNSVRSIQYLGAVN